MTRLKNVLLLNGLSSAATGMGLIIFAPQVAGLFDVLQPHAFYGTGIFLLVFAAIVLLESKRNTIHTKAVLMIITLDIAWVLASAVIVLGGLFNLSLIGYVTISAVAAWVAAMAYLQTKGVKQVVS